VINKSIKFLALLFLTLNVYAGGDDRDQVYYENLDEELAAFEAQLAEEQAKAEIDAFKAEMEAALAEQKVEDELAAFEAQLEAELAAQEMMAEIEAEMARQAALDAFQQKLEEERAAAAKATAAYQSKLARDAEIAARMAEIEIEKEIAAFEAQLAAQAAAAEMMAEIEREMALAAFQQKLEDEKAAAAAAQAAYKAKQEEVIGELVVEDEVIEVTAEAHEACKYALGLSDANIALFEASLADGTLFNKGPQSTNGTEFGASRWDAYANCVSNYVNPF